ncbi:hypothetical protein MLOOGBEN_17470 [Bacillus sp. EB106-08-02-XG196]|uniref:hypothetical protein n=1 Tax=Bacillus sp. EB106-08-02-XG196 TaxID=2737049 RepID=UPI0015C4C84F|nr:hypothetical protein [Bacillus sp. EB106-08-02-XG196]NWQ42495.1 hypothetical protein [Bacillus sp. EB106-08-02-XG196]
MTFLLPFLIILIIILGIVRILRSGRMKKVLQGSRLRWMLGGYVVILLICTGVSPLLPYKEVNYKIINNSQDIDKESTELYEAAVKGNIDKIDNKFVSKVWSLGYEERELNITTENDELISTAVIVERKTANDGKIEALHFKTRSGVNNMEITELEKPITVELNGKTLTIMNPEKVKLKFSQFQQAFTVNQFTGEKPFRHSTRFYGGTSILYLKIPKDLKLVDNSNINYQFIE